MLFVLFKHTIVLQNICTIQSPHVLKLEKCLYYMIMPLLEKIVVPLTLKKCIYT